MPVQGLGEETVAPDWPRELAKLPSLIPSDSSGDSELSRWKERRREIVEMLEHFQYGKMPPAPDEVSVGSRVVTVLESMQVQEERVTLSMSHHHKILLRMALYKPLTEGPFPCLIREEHALGHLEEVPAIVARGYAFVEFAREDLDPDLPGVAGAAQSAFANYDWATLAVWAWGAMRVVDYLETRDDLMLDQLGIVGHSRGGKMALLAGALDERFSLVVANGSGAGGGGSYYFQPDGCETLEMITRPDRFAYWFHPRLRDFAGREKELPFDQHFLKALVAPRALLLTDARQDHWANPLGTFLTSLAAREVFGLYGLPDRIGSHFRAGQHDLLKEDWSAILDFADWHFRGRRPEQTDRFWQAP